MKISLFVVLIFLICFGACKLGSKDKIAEAYVPESETEQLKEPKVQRFGMVIKVKPEKLEEYKKLHANPWPGIMNMLTECNIRNYSIYYKDGYLFSYFEYVGNDFEADMKKMGDDSLTQEWWKLTDPCQIPLETRKEGEWWATMEEIFHLD